MPCTNRLVRACLDISVALVFAACSDGASAPQDAGGTDTVRSDAAADGAPVDGGPRVDLPDTSDAKVSCPAMTGSASLLGVVQGKTLTATHGGAIKRDFGGLVGYLIGFWNQPGACDVLWTPPAFQQAVIGIKLCTTKPGTYSIGSSCGGVSVVNMVSIPKPKKDVNATSGSITIDSFDVPCGGKVKGSFSVSFSGDQLTGTFDTKSCGELK
jgi:hypothetical protein